MSQGEKFRRRILSGTADTNIRFDELANYLKRWASRSV
jgi:hypothetical protein